MNFTLNRLKKALHENQSRAVLATKELSKVQYENANLQLQAKRSEVFRIHNSCMIG